MLTDEAIINLKAGKGGDGLVHFRREKFIAKGGPDGGDGGKGGNVIIECSETSHTLFEYSKKKLFKAEDGEPGGKNKRSGKNGENLTLQVPPGTIINKIKNKTIEKVRDLTVEGEKFVIAKGGRGGWGNIHFATATHQTPLEANEGTLGDDFDIKFELKIIADVGLVGLPNVGKSTLLSIVSNARPKIADYKFTTLEPNLGIVSYYDRNLIFADIPGLIEGASAGKGLGLKFLRHIERARVLLHIIDANSDDWNRDYEEVRNEFIKFSTLLTDKKEIVAISKIDSADPKKIKKQAILFEKKYKIKPTLFSAVTKTNVKELLHEVFAMF
ncbi:MAG: GTPase ObgE [Patescibacteria group bacterium]|jgi:GTP-binding protein